MLLYATSGNDIATVRQRRDRRRHQRPRDRPADRRKPRRHRRPPGQPGAVRRRQHRPAVHDQPAHRRRHPARVGRRRSPSAGRRSASTSTPSPTACASSATPAQNVRLNPDDGTLAATDTPITPAGVTLTGLAYDRNGAGGTATTLFAIDATNGVLTTVGSVNGSPNSPNGGVAGPAVGSLGLGTGLDPRLGFDISGLNNANPFATILTGGTDKLYAINLGTGAATLVGTIGNGTTVYSGLTNAVAAPEPASLATAGAVALLGLLGRRGRRR